MTAPALPQPPTVAVVDLDELLVHLDDPWADETLSPLHGGPGLVVVALDGARAPLLEGIDTSRPRSWVLVGVDRAGQVPEGFAALCDVLLTTAAPPTGREWVGSVDIDADIAALWAAVEASPMAAIALAQLLRLGERATLEQAIALESLTYSTLLGGPEFAAWRAATPARVRAADPPPLVRVERFHDELHLSLARPRKHNAYSAALRDELVEALRLVLLDTSVERVVLRGDGPSFSSGGDLDEFGTAPDPATAHLIRWARSAAALVHRSRDRVEAQLHGACIGAGIEIPAAAGRVVAQPDVRIVLPEVAMGLVPGAGGTATIPRRIGRHRTCFMGITARQLDAAGALAWGLVDEVVPAP